MTVFNLQVLLNVSNPRPLYRFLSLHDIYDRQNKKLKVTEEKFVSEYKKYIYQRLIDSLAKGKRGRPRLVKAD